MEFVKSRYVLGRYVPELKDQGREGSFIKEEGRYERRVERIFRTVEFGGGRVLKYSFVLVSGG